MGMAEAELRKVFRVHGNAMELHQRRSSDVSSKLGRAASSSFLRSFVENWDTSRTHVMLDTITGMIVLVNAIFVGISMDSQTLHTGLLMLVDCIFAMIFWAEL